MLTHRRLDVETELDEIETLSYPDPTTGKLVARTDDALHRLRAVVARKEQLRATTATRRKTEPETSSDASKVPEPWKTPEQQHEREAALRQKYKGEEQKTRWNLILFGFIFLLHILPFGILFLLQLR